MIARDRIVRFASRSPVRTPVVARDLGVVLVAVVLASATFGAVAAQSTPLFQVPFTCNEEWDARSYENHTSFYGTRGDLPVDFNHERGNSYERGRPVLASAAGRVIRTQASNGIVEIDHGGGWTTLYGHMDTTLVSQGATVGQGDQIGTVGARSTTGDHLHYEQALDRTAQPARFNGEAFHYGAPAPTPLVSRNCPGRALPPTPPARSGPPQPTADYRFADTLRSSVGAPPELEVVGSGVSFATEVVDGVDRRVFRFPERAGLELSPTCGVVWDGNYSIVMLVRLESVVGYRRVIDWRAGKSDRGLYVNSGRVTFWGQGEETPGAVVPPNAYVQLVVTREDSSNTVAAYVNGSTVLRFAYTTDIAVLDFDRTLRFFRDDELLPGDDAAGAIARLRFYDAALTATEVAELDRLPAPDAPEGGTAPSPATCEGGASATPNPSTSTSPGPTTTASPEPSPSPSESPTRSCSGRPASLVGSSADETITGTAGDDVIAAGGGNDRIRSLGGDDVVCGGSGRDYVEGGGGADIMVGHGANDNLIGGAGRDRAVGGSGRDRCRAESQRTCEA